MFSKSVNLFLLVVVVCACGNLQLCKAESAAVTEVPMRIGVQRAAGANDTHADPALEIIEMLDINNDTLLDLEEFHAWFELVFPVLVEHEGGHAHRRRDLDSSPIERRRRSAIQTRLLILAVTKQQSFNSHSQTPSADLPSLRDRGMNEARAVGGHVHVNGSCPLDEDLFAEFDADGSGFLNETEVEAVGLEMMVLLLDGCNEEPEEVIEECSAPEPHEYWLAGIGSTLLICLMSLVGVILLPCMSRKHRGWQAFVMMAMVAFAAGALFGDAIFHILPEIFGAHSHGDEGGGHAGHAGHAEEEESGNEKEYLGLASLVFVGTLLFFLIEKFVLFFVGEGHSHGASMDSEEDETPKDEENAQDDTKTEEENSSDASDKDGESSSSDETESEEEQSGSRIGLVVMKLQSSMQTSYDDLKELGDGSVIKGGAKELKKQSIKSVKRLQFAKSYGWLNLVADAFHNFIDGLAIGASYSQNLSLGISTTLAVIFHEIPQELGDYAMIVRAGFGKIFALLFNLFSALLAILGCIIGLGVGESASEGEKWILAFTAGGFLYISLANMVPELHQYKKKLHWSGLVYIALQVSGFILGAGCLLILAAFEEDISFSC